MDVMEERIYWTEDWSDVHSVSKLINFFYRKWLAFFFFYTESKLIRMWTFFFLIIRIWTSKIKSNQN